MPDAAVIYCFVVHGVPTSDVNPPVHAYAVYVFHMRFMQIPAYEFAFSDVNPPVHAWAVLKVYKASGPTNHRDVLFLARCFHKLVLNFTWWVPHACYRLCK